MKDETIDDQNRLIDHLEEAGWNVSRIETREREYTDRDTRSVTEVAIELLVTKEYRDEDFENPYRVK